ncbi:MAG: hypothetical protein ACLU9S_20320 [Oscillospiraceae bacterium]
MFMHSVVATNLENLNLLTALKYTDKDGVTRDLTLYSWNGKLVVSGRRRCPPRLATSPPTPPPRGPQVKASDATDGQINQADVTPTLGRAHPVRQLCGARHPVHQLCAGRRRDQL